MLEILSKFAISARLLREKEVLTMDLYAENSQSINPYVRLCFAEKVDEKQCRRQICLWAQIETATLEATMAASRTPPKAPCHQNLLPQPCYSCVYTIVYNRPFSNLVCYNHIPESRLSAPPLPRKTLASTFALKIDANSAYVCGFALSNIPPSSLMSRARYNGP